MTGKQTQKVVRVVRKDPDEDVLLTEKERAARWSFNPASLANQRSKGAGPRYITLGRTVRYRLSDVVAFERLDGKR